MWLPSALMMLNYLFKPFSTVPKISLKTLAYCFRCFAKIILLKIKKKDLKISFWEYSFIVNKHNQKPIDIFNKQWLLDCEVENLVYLNLLIFNVC